MTTPTPRDIELAEPSIEAIQAAHDAFLEARRAFADVTAATRIYARAMEKFAAAQVEAAVAAARAEMSGRGERIASEFSTNKCHLTDAEQRRLAQMIDDERCPHCKSDANKYPDGECQHGFYW